MLAPGIGRGSRSFSSIPIEYQSTVLLGAKIIENYTLYQKPLLTPGEILLLVRNTWEAAQTEQNRYVEKIKVVDIYVGQLNSTYTRRIANLKQLRSIHTRTRGHLVAGCRANIAKIYDMHQLSKDERKDKVDDLLRENSFLCRRASRSVSRC